MRVRASQGIPSTWTCKPGNDGRKNRGAHPARILRNAILTRARPCADFPSNSHCFGENPRLAVVVGLLGMPAERVLCDLGEDPFFGIPVTRLALQDDFIPDLSADERLDEFLDGGDPGGLPSVQLRIVEPNRGPDRNGAARVRIPAHEDILHRPSVDDHSDALLAEPVWVAGLHGLAPSAEAAHDSRSLEG